MTRLGPRSVGMRSERAVRSTLARVECGNTLRRLTPGPGSGQPHLRRLRLVCQTKLLLAAGDSSSALEAVQPERVLNEAMATCTPWQKVARLCIHRHVVHPVGRGAVPPAMTLSRHATYATYPSSGRRSGVRRFHGERSFPGIIPR